MPSPAPTPAGNTTVTILASSTANDQLSRFHLRLTGLTLTSQSGKTVNVLSAQSAEFLHLNGGVEPLVTVSIPQDVYTSAAATVEPDANSLTCVGQNAAALELFFNSAFANTPGQVTVNLPAPITVTGTSMGMALNLQVSKSVSAFNCVVTSAPAPVNPVFNLTPVTIAAQPTNSSNGKLTGLLGLIGNLAANGTGFSVNAADGPVWQVSTTSGTAFQGVTSASQLAAGMPVEMDASLQADGTLLANRIAVYDTDTTGLSTMIGPLAEVTPSVPVLLSLNVAGGGPLFSEDIPSPTSFSFANTVFQASGALTNLQSLPFTASFSASNMVSGQSVFITSHASFATGGPNYTPAATITLLPQTINGTVSAVSNSGSFTTYTVTLAPYDLFPDLAVQPAEPVLLKNPNTVVVYADNNTQMLNTTALAVGGVLRFHGLVFNDNGTLRMDCSQINDGVTE